jgi:hypothetical protein
MLLRVERECGSFSNPRHLFYDNTTEEQLGILNFQIGKVHLRLGASFGLTLDRLAFT